MADILPGVSAEAFGELLWSSMPPTILNNFNSLLSLAKAISIVFIVYIAFLIVKTVIQTRQALRLKSIEQTLLSINENLEHLVGKKEPKKDKKHTKE